MSVLCMHYTVMFTYVYFQLSIYSITISYLGSVFPRSETKSSRYRKAKTTTFSVELQGRSKIIDRYLCQLICGMYDLSSATVILWYSSLTFLLSSGADVIYNQVIQDHERASEMRLH